MVIFHFYKIIKGYLSKIKQYYFTAIVRYKAAKCSGKILVINRSSVTTNTYLGNNVNFQGMLITGKGKVVIGDNFHSGKGCIIMSHYHNYDHGAKIPYDDTYIIKDVIIEDNVWLGLNVTLLPGITLGEGSIIQAGSIVVSNIPSLAIAGGHPAKVFKYRDKEHYYRLKEENRFH
ncbi:galactoside O-acetyltransferase [Aquipluma nitroreducens]|uniref:Galactoside O-acetyltransferase n=1 Tax=Aquipluma nitroreducens TaxID=2010828 RepID=A0A5K7S3W8_9BACT|nr:acyltransferase [Aquipluma nitroreducens]BBE16226.1 galactoside O-acetyltransferase [Aquipluma nitroreducens]